MKARGKRALADFIYYCKMTSDGVTLFLSLKYVTKTCKECDTVQLLAGILQYNGGKLEEAEDFKCLLFIVYWNSNRSALMRELLSNSSLSVSCAKINHSC